MLRRVALIRTDVSVELSAAIIRVTRIGELGTTLAVTSNRRTLQRNKFLRNVGSYKSHKALTSQKTPFFSGKWLLGAGCDCVGGGILCKVSECALPKNVIHPLHSTVLFTFSVPSLNDAQRATVKIKRPLLILHFAFRMKTGSRDSYPSPPRNFPTVLSMIMLASYIIPIVSLVIYFTSSTHNSYFTTRLGATKTNSVALSPQANYTDWVTATCRWNLVPTWVDRGVSGGQRITHAR
jgi:hypothetical protein